MVERQRVRSGSPYEPAVGFSRAVRVGERVLVAGTGPVQPDRSCPPDATAQAERIMEIITAALAEAGARPEEVVRSRMLLTHAEDADAVGEVHRAHLGAAAPAATMAVVAGLADPRWRVEIEVEAVIGAT